MKLSIEKAIRHLEDHGFSKIEDRLSEYSSNADLYFRKIGKQKYIVLNHYNKNKRKEYQGLDAWLSNYKTDTDIGKKKALNIENIKLTINLQTDWDLIAQYF